MSRNLLVHLVHVLLFVCFGLVCHGRCLQGMVLFETNRVSGVGEWRVSVPIGVFRRGDGGWQAGGSRGSGFFWRVGLPLRGEVYMEYF